MDAGSDTAANLGLDQQTTRTDLVADTGIVDIGYHYPSDAVQPLSGDADCDCDADGIDVAAFNLDGVTGVDEGDLSIFAGHFEN